MRPPQRCWPLGWYWKQVFAVTTAACLLTVVAAAPPWRAILDQPADWYGSDEAQQVAESVLLYQRENGGWPKNIDMTVPPVAGALLGRATIDNDATTTQLYLLARVATARPPAEAIRHAVERGIDYLLAAQYPHGGWPQIYPPRNDYTRHVTFNDDAMVNVLELLQEVASGLAPFGWIDPGRRDSARGAVERGVDCIVRAQVKIDGRLTAWCAQHDAATLAPAPARTFEPISLSGAETTGILRFLMSLPDPSPEVQTAVEAGVAWLRDVQLPGVRIVRPRLEDGRLDQRLEPATEGLPVWARFYEIPTQRPIYAGRDAVIRYDLAEVEQERRAGYNYLGHWGQPVLTELYPAWRDRIRRLADL